METNLKPDAQWIRARRELLDKVKSEVLNRLGPTPADVRTFGRRLEREFRVDWAPSSKSELLIEIERASVVYGGDFHALGQAQRTHVKILKAISNRRPVVLALECFTVSAQKWIDAYLDGRITVEELKVKSKWNREWGFPFEHYKSLLEVAKRRGFRILALNLAARNRRANSLEAREEYAAELLHSALRSIPNALIYVVFGDLHLAKKHLPGRVRARVKNSIRGFRDLIVHLNSERIYFELAQQGRELDIDVVRLTDRSFCILSSPPWVQWQSYLLFLEKLENDGLARDDFDSTSDVDGEFDPTDQVAELVKLAAHDLGLGAVKVDSLSVYAADDNRVWRAIERALGAKDREVARLWLAGGRSFFLPKGGLGFLSNDTINHAAALAGQYLHAKLSGRRRALWAMPGDFQALVFVEAIGYFVSKLINHKRQAETLADLRAQLAIMGPDDQGREALKLALDHSLSELVFLRLGRKRKTQYRPRRRASWYEAARILGGMLGERLYLAYRSRKIDRKEIIRFMKVDVEGSDFVSFYEEALRKVSGRSSAALHLRTKSKNERL